MTKSKEYLDLFYITEILSSGSQEQLLELEQLVDGFPKGVDEFTGRRWIINALYSGSLMAIEWILSRNVDISFRDDEGYTVLHAALDRPKPDKYDVLKLLLQQGAPVNIHGINDWTPSHMAAVHDDVVALEILEAYGADFSIRTNIDNYYTPFEEAKSIGKKNAIRFLQRFA